MLREHLAPLLKRTSRSTHLPLATCADSVLVDDLVAPVDLPLFVNSQMDGYAVRAADVSGADAGSPARLRVVGRTVAGQAPGGTLRDGEAHAIMTGATVPDGADCVIPVEDTEKDGDSVLVHAPRSAGTFIRRPGEDVRAGEVVIAAGTRLKARHLAAAASLGASGLDVRPRPRVSVVATGSELVSPGRPLGPGQIWESISIALSAAVVDCGGTISAVLTASDLREDFIHAMTVAADDADLVITVGAVSMGEAEVVRQVLGERDGSRFSPIAMQPGGPQGLSTWRDTPVVCLPGNPVSALVSFVVLLRPVILEAVGREPLRATRGRLDRAVDSPPGKAQYLRAALTVDPAGGLPTARPVSGPGSHLVASMARADVLIEIAADITSLPAGTEVDLLPL